MIRFTAVGTGVDTRTFEFDSYINNGAYFTLGGSPNSGEVIITGLTDAVPEPASLGLAALRLALVISRRKVAAGIKSVTLRA